MLSPKVILEAKLRLLRMHFESGVGHIGGNLSCLDILLALYHSVLGEQDRFVLSKGHSAGALYVALWSIGALTEADLQQFHKDGTRLPGHPPASGIPEILFGTGSLGHGLGLAAGLALAKKLRNEPGRVYCLTSDGEWNEGSSWEALIFIAHQRLDNLVLIVDLNGMQGFGATRDIAKLDSLADKFQMFGVDAIEVDGHDIEQLTLELGAPRNKPLAVIARTRKGNGVSYMQDRFEWHYLPMSQAQYEQAAREMQPQ